MSKKLFFLSFLFLILGLWVPLKGQSADEINWYSMEEAQQLATDNDKKVMVFAEAEWCTYCRQMYEEVFPEQAVRDSLEKYYYPVRVDIESQEPLMFNESEMTGREFARSQRVTGTPSTFFVDSGGEILGVQPGFIPAEVFKGLLAYVGAGLYGQIEFEEYMKQNDISQ